MMWCVIVFGRVTNKQFWSDSEWGWYKVVIPRFVSLYGRQSKLVDYLLVCADKSRYVWLFLKHGILPLYPTIVREWNSLPKNVTSASTVDGFRASLVARLGPANQDGYLRPVHNQFHVLTKNWGTVVSFPPYLCTRLWGPIMFITLYWKKRNMNNMNIIYPGIVSR